MPTITPWVVRSPVPTTAGRAVALVRGRIDQLAEVEVSHGGDCRPGRRDHREAAPDLRAGRRTSRRYRSRR